MYVLNEQQSRFRATHTARIQSDAGRFHRKVFVTLYSAVDEGRPLGQNILHHIKLLLRMTFLFTFWCNQLSILILLIAEWIHV